MKTNKQYIFLLIICSVVFYFINALIPIISDDLLYGCMFPEIHSLNTPWGIDFDKPIKDVSDIFVSQYNHYFNHGGRIPVHFAVQIFSGLLGKPLYSVISALFFALFILLLGLNSFGNQKKRIVDFIPFIILYLLIIQPKCFYSTIATGINYLWASVLCLAYLYFFGRHLDLKHPISIILYWGLSFFAGWSHEGIIIPLSIALLVYSLNHIKQMSSSDMISIVFFYLGVAFLILAPGNYVRSEQESVGFSLENIIVFFFNLRVLYLYILSIFILLWIKGLDFVRVFMKENISLNVGVLLGICVFSIMGGAVLRAGYGIELFSVILVGRILKILLPQNALQRVGKIAGITTILCLCVVCYYQKQANEHFYTITNQLELSSDDKVIVNINMKHTTPKFLDGFVRNCTYDTSLKWMLKVWKAKYKKDTIILNQVY